MEHQSVLFQESIEALSIRPLGTYVDGTFGRGGHSRGILERLAPRGRLFAFDRDPEAVMAAEAIQDPRFKLVHSAFSGMAPALLSFGVRRVDGVLLDLGVSSPQLDQAERGFSFRREGPLDMRMDTSRGETVAEFIDRIDEEALVRVLRTYGEERFAKRIARAILAARPLRSTLALARVVASVTPRGDGAVDPLTRTFQALRIAVNAELQEIEAVLPQALHLLEDGGRLAVISFHSLEDRLVKQFMARESSPPELPPGLAVRESDRPKPALKRVGKAIFPTHLEMQNNPRSRSAVLRVAEKIGGHHETH